MLINIIVAGLAVVIGLWLAPYVLSILSVLFWGAVCFGLLWAYRNR